MGDYLQPSRHRLKLKLTIQIGMSIFGLLSIDGCGNLFSIFDKPSGDAQILEAARGCFDRGDYTCATKYYSQVSTASGDEANSGYAFELLAQNGMTASVFMNVVASGINSGGNLVTLLANPLIAQSGQTARLGMFHAYQKASNINNIQVQGLVRFITSLVLLSEIVAESAHSTTLKQTDIANNPTGCLAATPFPAGFLLDPADCNGPSNSKLTSGATVINLPTATDAQMSGTPNLHMISAAVGEIINGLTQLAASGSLSGSSLSFANALLTATLGVDPADSPGFRGAMIYLGVGQ